MTLPDGVAFKLGGNEIKSVIIQGNLLRGIDNKTVKVQLFWKGQKNLKKSPPFFDKLADLLGKRQNKQERFFQILWPSHNVLTLEDREF